MFLSSRRSPGWPKARPSSSNGSAISVSTRTRTRTAPSSTAPSLCATPRRARHSLSKIVAEGRDCRNFRYAFWMCGKFRMSESKPPIEGQPSRTTKNIAALLQRAAALHRQGRTDEAEFLYRSVLAEDPQQFDALHLLGFVHYQRGQHAAAAELIDRAIGINPAVSASHSNRGLVLQALKRPEHALLRYDHPLRLRPDNTEAHNNRGSALLDLKRPEEALASFDRALQRKPDYVDALNNRGNALRDLDRPDEALASFDRALEHNPDDATVLMNRGNALLELKRADEALASYARALLFE